MIREACLREIKRGGQVYFLHNEVETIDNMARELAALVPGGRYRHRPRPDARARSGAGDAGFLPPPLQHPGVHHHHRKRHRRAHAPIPSSSNRADKLGLAQLHQLRGRVGRSHHRAYAYLIIPPRRALTADAEKRLDAIESLEELGAGFTLATHDLEIRGAGELLGEEQSGQIHEIGFSLYMDLLERAVKALREGRTPALDQPLHQGPEIDLQVPALIPDDYLPDVHTRLMLYKRIASAQGQQELDDLQVEMIDRFGLLPEAAKNLFRIGALKLQAAPMGIRKIELGSQEGRILFSATPDIDTAKLIELIQTQAQHYRFDGVNKLRLFGDFATPAARFAKVQQVLDLLAVRG